MTLDTRGTRAREAVVERMGDRRPDRGDLHARQAQRQRRRMRTVLAAFVVLVVLAAPLALLSLSDGTHVGPAAPGLGELPPGSQTSGAWSSVPVHGSGLGDGSAVRALTSTGDAVLAVGSRTADGVQTATVWRSEDGLNWAPVEQPQVSGALTAVEAHGDMVLAVGASSRVGGPADMVWRSTDGGRTFGPVAEGSDLFGSPAPEMGRPFVAVLRWVDGRWVAGGGAADGYGGTWVSHDGAEWSSTFPDNTVGGVDLASQPDGAVLGYWLDQVWSSTDGQVWSRVDPALPNGLGLRSVASGAAAAVGDPFHEATHTTPTPILRSADAGLTWVTDDSFLGADPSATALRVEVVDGLVVVMGSEDGSERPEAWVSGATGSWLGIPAALTEGDDGGPLALSASLGSTVVLMSGQPTSPRIYILHT